MHKPYQYIQLDEQMFHLTITIDTHINQEAFNQGMNQSIVMKIRLPILKSSRQPMFRETNYQTVEYCNNYR